MTWEGLLRHLRASSADRLLLSFAEIERLIGGPLPSSARKHAAFWSNTSTYAKAWRPAGFTVSRAGCLPEEVVFVRTGAGAEHQPTAGTSSPDRARPTSSPGAAPHLPSVPAAAASAAGAVGALRDSPPARKEPVRAVLVGCVKTKLHHPAPAEDLYISPLFRRRRAYAEAAGVPWFILSAKFGLIAPHDVVAPYDMAMAAQSTDYRRVWGQWVAQQLIVVVGPLHTKLFEVHAGAAYVEPLEAALHAHGARLVAPLQGLTQGEHLAWYAAQEAQPERPNGEVDALVSALADPAAARPAVDFPWGDAAAFDEAGLYSWWVDAAGAAMLAAGLDHPVEPGLIYAGQAGATAWPA
jgi:hypothetical protein